VLAGIACGLWQLAASFAYQYGQRCKTKMPRLTSMGGPVWSERVSQLSTNTCFVIQRRGELTIEIKELQNNFGSDELPPDDLLFHARNRAETKITEAAEYVECVSVGRLTQFVFYGLLASAVLILGSLIGRWIFNGFPKGAK
jgi:hypothetical protein